MLLRLVLCASCASALQLPAGVTTAAAAAAAAAVFSTTAATAYDVPPLTSYDDPAIRKTFAARPNPQLKSQQTAAFYAVSTGDMPTLTAMADAGWDLAKACDHTGKTVLHRAAQVGNAPAVAVLLKAGAVVDGTNTWDETPLHMATRNGKLPVVKQLVESGADVSKKTYGGDTALDLAKKYRMTSVEEYLTASK